MPTYLVAFLLAPVIFSHALAKFTTLGCWQRNCLVQNDAGTLCLQAAFNGPPNDCNDAVLSLLLDVHIHSKIGLSIAYYDERGHFLGPTIWPVPAPLPFAVYVCMSGRRSDANNHYRTLCRTALHDDDVYNASSHDRACGVERPQEFVSDGCYTVDPVPSTNPGPLDAPALVHALFVLGGIVTIGTLVAYFRRSLQNGWRYFATSRYGRRILGVTRREGLIPRAFDINLYPPSTVTRRQGNPRVDFRDRVALTQPATATVGPLVERDPPPDGGKPRFRCSAVESDQIRRLRTNCA